MAVVTYVGRCGSVGGATEVISVCRLTLVLVMSVRTGFVVGLLVHEADVVACLVPAGCDLVVVEVPYDSWFGYRRRDSFMSVWCRSVLSGTGLALGGDCRMTCELDIPHLR